MCLASTEGALSGQQKHATLVRHATGTEHSSVPGTTHWLNHSVSNCASDNRRCKYGEICNLEKCNPTEIKPIWYIYQYKGLLLCVGICVYIQSLFGLSV